MNITRAQRARLHDYAPTPEDIDALILALDTATERLSNERTKRSWAEARATRAEAQSETRRINTEYWQGVARANATTADVWKESAEEAQARIEAVRELHQPVGLTAHTGPRIEPSGEPIPDDTPVCGYCTDPDALGWCDYPCPTIRALDGDA